MNEPLQANDETSGQEFNPELSVLIVDDTPENLVALEVVLDDVDCTLVTASSGNEALGKLLKQDFALVLLDVQMPGMDGFEVAELMRNNKRTAHVPIIFVTANSRDERNMRKGYQSGAVDYLFKPIDPTVLCSKVNFFLQLERQKKRLEAKIKASRESEQVFLQAYGKE
ncbi:MAG: response regulator [Alcanivoracaceae bacterium]|jgi:CheY-like chemotaxis protein|nr:response regulator [Alcanivoracaceae bacterium]